MASITSPYNAVKQCGSGKRICAVVIPIYKPEPSDNEIASLRQCLKVLNHYDIVFVTHKDLDRAAYEKICTTVRDAQVSYQYFTKQYFTNIEGYNALVLSRQFYRRFMGYDYMLIYQLDAWVFSDQLQYWCDKQYDYIGAPWLIHQAGKRKPVPRVIPVGNGGFSLRNVNTFLRMCSTLRIHLLRWYHYSRSKFLKTGKSKKYALGFVSRVLRKMWYIFYGDKRQNSDNEDTVFSFLLFLKKNNIPAWREALLFAFETCPDYCFELNGGQLPFGAHDVRGYDLIGEDRVMRYEFWKSIYLKKDRIGLNDEFSKEAPYVNL